MECPYSVLNLDRDATDTDIKKAYRKLSIEHHPDKAGDPEMFNKITAARDILLDSELRKAYDQGGHILVKHFREAREKLKQQQLKCEPIVVQKHITIHDLYYENEIELSIDRPDREPFVMKFKATLGNIIAECEGRREQNRIDGDIIVQVILTEDSPFRVSGHDIHYRAEIGLRDIFEGYDIIVPHPANNYRIKGQFSPDQPSLCFKGLGIAGGSLIVSLEVDYMKDLDSNTIRQILKCLKPRPESNAESIDISGTDGQPERGCPIQ